MKTNFNRIGASTANFYPLETELALGEVLNGGFKKVEIFLNSISETETEFVELFKAGLKAHKATVVAIHACTSSYESFLFYSNYERRLHDGLEIYKKIYKFAADLGAKYVVMHGDRATGKLTYDESIERFMRVATLGESFGITLLLENVFNFRGSEIEYILKMKEKIGKYANFVFDLKQSYRSNCDFKKIISAMGTSLKHVHISDNNASSECILPGNGDFDFAEFFRFLKEFNYNGAFIIELYNHSFSGLEDLKKGGIFLENQLNIL